MRKQSATWTTRVAMVLFLILAATPVHAQDQALPPPPQQMPPAAIGTMQLPNGANTVNTGILATPDVAGLASQSTATSTPAEVTTPRNPFSYNIPEDSKGFVPTLTSTVPPGIRVVGIICVEGREPQAVLSVPGYESPFYVQKKDVIAITGMSTTRSRNGRTTEMGTEPLYVEIGEIDEKQVALYPKANPSNIQILR